jgi:hypothetical protein
MNVLAEYRFVISLAGSAVVGSLGLHLWPFPAANAFLMLIAARRPDVHAAFTYTYATLWFSTPFLALSTVLSVLYIFVGRNVRPHTPGALPPYPDARQREELFLVLGEQHHETEVGPAPEPRWLTIPERGLYTGIAIVGAIGTGKTSACMHPFIEQLMAFKADDTDHKVGGLVLEVKGDFCAQVREILERQGRGGDYVEVSLTSRYRYNPLHNDLDAYALAYGIATLMTNLYGRGKEPFWQQASTNLIKFVILLHQTLDDYVTLFQVYEHVINPDKLRARIVEGEARFGARNRRIVVDKREHLLSDALQPWRWSDVEGGRETWTQWSSEAVSVLQAAGVAHRVEGTEPAPDQAYRTARFDAVKRWFEDDWTRIEPKLRTSIVEGVSVFLSLFDDNPQVKHTFCPPKEMYDSTANADERYGVPLPPMSELIEQGKVVALNFPIAMNPGLARALGTMLKQDFQRAVLNRVPKMSAAPELPWRPLVFLCDEYQAFATAGENEPSGDEKFFSLARQAKCIPIVATQSISSLRSTLAGETWRTLLQGLRTKIFLAMSDDFSTKVAADLCGRAERLKPGYTLTESGQDARVSMLTGRPAAHRSTMSASKTYSLVLDYVFQPKAFAELQNAQAIVLPYDGINPQAPTYCYLKPNYLPVQQTYFEHVQAGVL